MTNPELSAGVGPEEDNLPNPLREGSIQLGTGELLDTKAVASEDRDRITNGFLMLARDIGSIAAARMYRIYRPNSNLDDRWFEDHLHEATIQQLG